MRVSKHRPSYAKLALIVVPFALTSLCATGCETDQKPSQMVKIRGQMQQQRDAMKGNQSTAPMPPNMQAGGTTGK